jgi:hypothetical protein
MNQFPIYIPSKGRYECITAKQLIKMNIPFKIVIEPQDLDDYQKKWKDLLILNRNDMGISYVRQAIINYAKSNHQKWIWIIDDDITEWWYRAGNDGCIKTNISCLKEVETNILNHPEKDIIGQVGLYHCVWACKKNCSIPFISENVGIVQVVAFNLPNINIKYDSDLNGMEDQDLTLRLLKSGIKTLRYNHFSFKTFNKGSNKGGLYTFYQNNPVSETVKKFYKKHFNENIKIVSWKIKNEKIIINWKKSFNFN